MTGWASAAREGRWADFEGLPSGLDVAALFAALGRTTGWSERPGLLGHEERTLSESEGLRCWLDATRVVLVELADPPSAVPAPELLARLGVPDWIRPGHPRSGATVTDYIYAARGLAITIAESYDDPASFEPLVAAVRLFEPTDLATYSGDLGGLERPVPRF